MTGMVVVTIIGGPTTRNHNEEVLRHHFVVSLLRAIVPACASQIHEAWAVIPSLEEFSVTHLVWYWLA